MKKTKRRILSILLSLAMMLGMLSGMSLTAYAEGQTVVWSGEKAVTQDNPVSIDKDKFSGIKLGDKIVVEFKDADGGLLSLFSNGKCLPGTSYNYVGSWDSAYEVFATQDMIKSLKQYGMDVSGYGYTVTKVSYEAGRDNLDVNTVWSGNFWMDSWSTLELSATSFSDVDWDEIEAIRFISEAGRSNWTLNIRTSWEEDGKVADQSSMTWKDNYFELSLDEIDVEAGLGHCGSGESYIATLKTYLDTALKNADDIGKPVKHEEQCKIHAHIGNVPDLVVFHKKIHLQFNQRRKESFGTPYASIT